jgi:hypothetical protein
MPSLTLFSAPMKARFTSFNLTLESVVPAPGSGVRVGNGLPMPKTGAQLANRPQAASLIAGNRPSLGALGAASSPPPAPTGTPMPCPPALFRAASNNKIDCDFQKSMHDELNKFFDAVTQGIIQGFGMWKIHAYFTGVQIMGPSAIGGKIEAPHFDSHIKSGTISAFGGPMSGWSNGLLEGVARGFSNQWIELCHRTMVPGLPWYPAFTAFPGPQTPPMPNIPTPFITLAPQVGLVTPWALKESMKQKAPNGTPYSEQVFTVVSEQLSTSLLSWMPQQQILGLMGKGPVPTFAPPYVPVGPVVGGTVDPNSRPFVA